VTETLRAAELTLFTLALYEKEMMTPLFWNQRYKFGLKKNMDGAGHQQLTPVILSY
jgi:hypothetical protein